jgi:hypothetical protein
MRDICGVVDEPLSREEAEELHRRWDEIKASKPSPPQVKGKPPVEYIEQAKAFRVREKAFLDALPASHRQQLQKAKKGGT